MVALASERGKDSPVNANEPIDLTSCRTPIVDAVTVVASVLDGDHDERATGDRGSVETVDYQGVTDEVISFGTVVDTELEPSFITIGGGNVNKESDVVFALLSFG